MARTAVPSTDRDVLDPAFWGDLDGMHATFRELRAQGPLAREATQGMWLILGHDEVVEVERRSDVFVSGRGYRSVHAPGEDNMISLDDPRHAEQRQLIARRFTPPENTPSPPPPPPPPPRGPVAPPAGSRHGRCGASSPTSPTSWTS